MTAYGFPSPLFGPRAVRLDSRRIALLRNLRPSLWPDLSGWVTPPIVISPSPHVLVSGEASGCVLASLCQDPVECVRHSTEDFGPGAKAHASCGPSTNPAVVGVAELLHSLIPLREYSHPSFRGRSSLSVRRVRP